MKLRRFTQRKPKKDLLSPTFKSTPKSKSIKLGKNKTIGDKHVPNIVEHFTNISTPVSNRKTTPETKEENVKTTNKVITSPIGFFKIDQSINESTDLKPRGTEKKGNKGEDQRHDTHFKYFRLHATENNESYDECSKLDSIFMQKK